jgi:hypothetical protein
MLQAEPEDGMNRRMIGLVGTLNVALLVATSAGGWETSDAVGLGVIELSPESPDHAIDGTVDVGRALLDNDFAFEAVVVLVGENLGGTGQIELLVGEDSEPEPFPEGVAILNAGLGEPLPFEVWLWAGLSAEDLEDLHLVVRVRGDAVIEADASLTIRGIGDEQPKKGRTQISIEVE